jgi:hypothetical protein
MAILPNYNSPFSSQPPAPPQGEEDQRHQEGEEDFEGVGGKGVRAFHRENPRG